MKIFMTGATGFVGRALSLQLQKEGHDLVALARDPARAQSLLGTGVKIVSTDDFSNGDDPRLAGVDAVINLAGEPVVGRRWSAAQKQRLIDSRVGLTQLVVKWMSAQPKPPGVLISASAVGFYGQRVDDPVDENSGAGTDFLATLCANWERAAHQAEDAGTRVVTLRTGIVLGQGGGVLARLEPLFRMAVGGRLGDGQQVVPWIHLQDMVNIIVTALHDSKLRGAINAVGPQPVTNAEFTRAIAEAVGRPAFLPVPRPMLRLLLGEASSAVLGGQRAMPTKLLDAEFEFQFPTIQSALRDLLQDDMGCKMSKVGDIPASNYLQQRPPVYELFQQTVINAPLAEVMEFFSQAENLAVLTPPNVDFSITSPTPIEMKAGAEISYTIKIGRIPIRWKTEIEQWEPGKRFVDAQLKGPYKSWWHEHTFRAFGQQCIMEDRVLYALPFGPIGRIVHRLKVSRMLLDIFTYRTRAIRLRFGAPATRVGTGPSTLVTRASSAAIAVGH